MIKQGDDTMNIEAKQKALSLVEQNPLVMMLGTVGPSGASEIKAMVKMRNDGLRRFWFCSNTSARRTEVLRRDGRACLYAYEYADDADPVVCRGVMFSGMAELSWDDDLRRSLWQDFMTMYYPKGPLDPDFVVMQFTAERGNYYEGLQNEDFPI
jgi:general stress protein 26